MASIVLLVVVAAFTLSGPSFELHNVGARIEPFEVMHRSKTRA